MSNISEGLNALKTGGKRIRIHNAQMVTKLPAVVKDLVNEYGAAVGMSEAAVVRDALAEYFEKRGYGRN